MGWRRNGAVMMERGMTSEDKVLEQLTARFGTPLYWYDGEELERNYCLLQSCIAPGMEIL